MNIYTSQLLITPMSFHSLASNFSLVFYLPSGESKSGKSRATAMKTFFIREFGT